ncbi:MAG: hypothetical protein ACR2RB_15985 [Gammaproteobacteria bacterium]
MIYPHVATPTDDAAPVTFGQPYPANQSVLITIPDAPGPWLDITGREFPQNSLQAVKHRTGGVIAAADPITLTEFAAVQALVGQGDAVAVSLTEDHSPVEIFSGINVADNASNNLASGLTWGDARTLYSGMRIWQRFTNNNVYQSPDFDLSDMKDGTDFRHPYHSDGEYQIANCDLGDGQFNFFAVSGGASITAPELKLFGIPKTKLDFTYPAPGIDNEVVLGRFHDGRLIKRISMALTAGVGTFTQLTFRNGVNNPTGSAVLQWGGWVQVAGGRVWAVPYQDTNALCAANILPDGRLMLQYSGADPTSGYAWCDYIEGP